MARARAFVSLAILGFFSSHSAEKCQPYTCERQQEACYAICNAQRTSGLCTAFELANHFTYLVAGVRGRCFLKVDHPCHEDAQCPPATICTQAKKGGERNCQACENSLRQSPECMERAVSEAIARWAVGYFGIPTSIEVEYTMHVFQEYYTASVVGSPIDAVHRVATSAKTLAPSSQAASRSGAVFFATGDGRFLIKGFGRAGEYAEIVELLTNFRHGANGSVLNMPSMAFPAFYRTYWSVMPDVDFMVRQQLGSDVIPFASNTFDVKPEPLISAERSLFFQFLRTVRFRVQDTKRILSFLDALESDLNYLSSRTLVDYSWLIKTFEMPASFRLSEVSQTARVGEPWCFESVQSENAVISFLRREVHESRTVIVCFSLIDYALAFEGLVMQIESAILRFKWSDYASKFRLLTRCLFLEYDKKHVMRIFGLAKLSLTRLDTWTPSQRQTSMDKNVIGFRLEMEHETGLPDIVKPCAAYRDASCSALIVDWWQSDSCSPNRTICSFLVEDRGEPAEAVQAEVDYCLTYLVERCTEHRSDLRNMGHLQLGAEEECAEMDRRGFCMVVSRLHSNETSDEAVLT